MRTVVRLDAGLPPAALWRAIGDAVRGWAAGSSVVLRDALLLLPSSAMLGDARRAFAALTGWSPRVETVRTLAAALGPPPPIQPGQISFDGASDALGATSMLAHQPSLRDWQRRDPRSFDLVVHRVVELAHELARAAANEPPLRRGAWWDRARERLAPADSPDQFERMLARIALEWAAASAPAATDALWALRPSAWIVLRAGRLQPIAEALAAASASTPTLVLEAAVAADAPMPARHRPQAIVCDGFEAEARAAAGRVLRHLAAGEVPVALVAQDRMLVRRVRALLARRAVPLADETGWRLSTTRAAGSVMSLLRAARAGATTDELLDALKAGGQRDAVAVDALELSLRRMRRLRIADVDPATFEPLPARAWHAATQRIALLQQPAQRPMEAWLDVLREALDVAWLRADAAGEQVLATLFRHEGSVGQRLDDERTPMPYAAFVAWVDASLEQSIFLPAAPAGAAAVVITPLARAALRPFAAVVLPGADERRLGGSAAPQALLGDAMAAELGLPDIDAQRDAEWQAFRQLLRVPRFTLLRRRVDGDEPLAPSPMVEWLLARGALDVATADEVIDVERRSVAPTPLARPLPTPAALPPRKLSASQVEALRECPYRFYARAYLRLREPQELDDDPDKRDFGTWLHGTLEAFHASRVPADAPSEIARLVAIGRAQLRAGGFDAAAFLPFATDLEPFAAHYVAWQHERDAQGATHVASELERDVRLAEWPELELHGRIDRVDRERGGATTLLDYKSSRADALKERVRERFEDTQLAMYALLELERDPSLDTSALRAAYVSVDQRDAIGFFEHRAVADSARALRAGLVDALRRVKAGAPLPALGEGRVCETCEARGLCRRDDWAA